jgi:trigger factor
LDEVKVEVKEGEGLQRKLTVVVPADTVKSETDRQLADFRKKAALKGFRRGKAPMNMIKALYGDEVQAMVADELIKSSYPEAIKEAKLRIASPPNVTDLDYDDEGGLTYTAEVEVFPEMAAVNFDGLKLVTSQVEVTDAEVDEIAEYYRIRFSGLKDVAREARDKDVLVLDLEKLDDPREIMKESTFSDVEIDLGKELTVKEFKESLPGMKAGEEKEIEVKYAEDYSDARFAGATIKYKCRVKTVNERILPAFDDALAKRSGQAETALELRLKIRDELAQEKREVERNGRKREVIKQLCQQNEIPIPEAMIDDYLNAALKDVRERFPDASEEEVRKDYREPGINSIRWNILFHRLSEQEKIEVLPSDTEKWISGFAEANKITVEQAKEALTKSQRADNLRESILEGKVLDFLINKAR